MKILHLEDDGPLREILAAALKATAPTCEIHQFINSDEALRYATENAQGVDLFILDVRVPGSMNGLQVAEKLRAIHCPGTIVITSAYRAPDEAVLRKLSCEWYPKPWHIFEATNKLVLMAQRKPAAPSVTPAAPVVNAAVPDGSPAPAAGATKPPAPPAKPETEAPPSPAVDSTKPPTPSVTPAAKDSPAPAAASDTPAAPVTSDDAPATAAPAAPPPSPADDSAR
jgi:CheY-like chemotaxis protein